MTKAIAYCTELKRNISLYEAHLEFFAHPEVKRRRLTFECGDPICRESKHPLVVAALYDREDAFNEKYKSPYFRVHAAHPHIENCTWVISAGVEKIVDGGLDSEPIVSKVVKKKLGLIFKISKTLKKSVKVNQVVNGSLVDSFEVPTRDKNEIEVDRESDRSQRPETTKFMTSVAYAYLTMSDFDRKSTSLQIEGLRKGTFHDVCIPIVGFHPHYQKTTIYQGIATVVELDNVFLIKFKSKVSAEGDRAKRYTSAEIKLTKIWLEENDRTLRATLSEIVEAKANAHCFFYSGLPIEISKGVGRFKIINSNFLGLIPEWKIRNEAARNT